MSDTPLDLDLKLMPDWMKEPAGKNPYADFAGESDRPRRDRGDRGDRNFGGGRGGPRRDGPGGPGGFRSNSGGPQGRPQGGRDGRPGRPERREGSRPGGSGRPGGPGGKRPPFKQGQRSDEARPPRAEQPPRIEIPIHVEMLPEPESVIAVTKQIKASHRAYPLYGLGRMFLNKPERHRVRVTSNAPAHPLFQVGEDGPVTLNRAAAEREAFRQQKAHFYSEETVEVEAPKGNFSNVARCRLTGTLLGPTNHHGYQPALRRLFEARFSRRMDFNEFLRQIEVVSDPVVIDEWKKQCSSVTVYKTTQEAEPVELKSLAEVEAHFRAHYLDRVLRSGRTLEMSGTASREVADREIRNAIRTIWEKERGFPSQLVNLVRPHFTEAGLQIWKHRKRILHVSPVRPVRFGAEAREMSAHVADLLNVIESTPKCSRSEISNRLLKPHEADPEFQKRKEGLAADLHWLIHSGHVIEFHDGTFDLPLAPKEQAKENAETASVEDEKAALAQESQQAAAAEAQAPAAPAPAVESVAEPVVEPIVAPVAESVAESAVEPVAEDTPAAE